MAERCSFTASDDTAAEACEEAIAGGLSPISVAIAGYLALAGEYPGILLGPLGLMLHGLGTSRAFDGRLRQPGIGAKRPRGFTESDAIPDSAYLTAPRAVPALFVALGYDSSRRLGDLFKHGLANAKRTGASQRRMVLNRIKELGAPAFSATELQRPLLHAGGPSEGGVLVQKDFEPGSDIDMETRCESLSAAAPRPALCVGLPWDVAATPLPGCVAGHIAVVDRRGMGVLLQYEQALQGVVVDELELVAPRAAVPVRRGQRRVPPGQPLPLCALGDLRAATDGAVVEIVPAPNELLRAPGR